VNILIAPDSFKESLTADEAAQAMARGARRVFPSARLVRRPLSDGGEGTADILTRHLKGRFLSVRVRGPLGNSVKARWGYVAKTRTAILDLASASGLALVPPHRRNPMRTSSYGTGELVRAAVAKGCRKIILGLGGSATVDAGLGILQALGARLSIGAGRTRAEKGPTDSSATGADLLRLSAIDVSCLNPRLRGTRVTLLCDVTNPLLGSRGAARVFGPQKGATPKQVRALEAGLRRFAAIAERFSSKKYRRLSGGGAAGGAAAGLAAFLRAEIRAGAPEIFSWAGVEESVRKATIILTGEGRADATTLEGKVAGELLRRARRRRKPLYLFAGSVGPGAEKLLAAGARAVVAINPPGGNWRKAPRKVPGRLAEAVERVLRSEGISARGRPGSGGRLPAR
jgi:glycerate 2-kinase